MSCAGGGRRAAGVGAAEQGSYREGGVGGQWASAQSAYRLSGGHGTGRVHSAGAPVAVKFMSLPFAEATLLKCAYSYEQGTKHRRPPRFGG